LIINSRCLLVKKLTLSGVPHCNIGSDSPTRALTMFFDKRYFANFAGKAKLL